MKLRSKRLTDMLKMAGIFGMLAMISTGYAQDAAAAEAPAYASYDAFTESAGFALFTVNNLWLLISAALVFLMHLGFATLETGLTQAKNTVNILFKNLAIVCIGILGYAFYGFNAMYPGDAWNISGVFALGSWFGVDNEDVSMVTDAYNNYTWWTDFIFQAMFAATAATIVSGAVAERIKLGSFLVYAILLVTFVYPITGSWQWGGGWLSSLGLGGEVDGEAIGFYDFAGSSLVHGFGGFAALAAVLVLGPRHGKYHDGKIRPILGHSMPLAMIGVMLLWLGWYGFNGGSVLSADPRAVSYVFVTTTLAAAAGAIASMGVSWAVLKKPDLSMALNGVLAGLVGITAGADSVGMGSSIIIGIVAGVLVVFAILFFDKLKIDDPVGAISVHGVCGVWGTVAVGIFADGKSLINQVVGCFAVIATAFVASYIIALLVKAVMGFRVDTEEEIEGLDIGEHGNEAYPDFTPAHKS